jgi:hypothetical protein
METEVTATSIALARQRLDMAASVLYVRAARAVGEWPRAGTPLTSRGMRLGVPAFDLLARIATGNIES